jgi:tRNA(Glu) U13 pseudouridine synthase TruD
LERLILFELKDRIHGYNNAFFKIARNTRMIYVHGYQSYIWNKSVSERIKKNGSDVLVGDLVVKREVCGGGSFEDMDDKVKIVTEENKEEFSLDGPLLMHLKLNF